MKELDDLLETFVSERDYEKRDFKAAVMKSSLEKGNLLIRNLSELLER